MSNQAATAESEAPVRPPYSAGKFIFVWSIHAISAISIVLWAFGAFTISWPTVALAVFWYVCSSMAITAGYHRLFTHGSYRANWIIRFLYMISGSAAVQGSILQWSAQHRDHHTFTDEPKDPYNIKLGFWYAHFGWVVRKTSPDYTRVNDLNKDLMIRLQHRFYDPIAVVTSFAMPALIGSLWGEAIGAFVLAGCLRLVIQWHMTFCVNSVAHYYGSQNYSAKNSARGGWWLSFLVWGEMDHNFHHAFPNDFRTGTRWWDFDPSKWWIFACSKLGLTSELRTADPERIERAVGKMTSH